jgi:hypothetical protein
VAARKTFVLTYLPAVNAAEFQEMCLASGVPASRSRRRDLSTGRCVVFPHRRMVFAARTSAWSRCPHSMQQKIAWPSRLTRINDTARRAGLRGVASTGHHDVGGASWRAPPINTGGFKAGWQCRQAAGWTIACDSGRLARLPSATLKLKSSMAVSS